MDGLRLLTDPVLRDRVAFLSRHGASIDAARYRHVDVVLVSHLHPDHLDLPSLRLVDTSALIIVPRGAGAFMVSRGFGNVIELAAGETWQNGRISVRATPAIHDRRRYRFGPAADPVGYVISGRRSVYFAGDTGPFAGMGRAAADLDVALLPVWGWGYRLGKHHLDPESAAEAAALLRPRLAIPIHWGTLRPLGIGWLKPKYLQDPPRRFVRHARNVAPDVAVTIVDPGESLRYDGSANGTEPL